MASKSCKEFLTVIPRTVFKLFRHRVNASSNSAIVTFFTVFKMCQHRLEAVLVSKLYSTYPLYVVILPDQILELIVVFLFLGRQEDATTMQTLTKTAKRKCFYSHIADTKIKKVK